MHQLDFAENQHTKDFFLARQPILDSSQALWGYELLFRNAAFGPAVVVDDMLATSSVISHLASLGVDQVLQGHVGFLNVDAKMLLSDVLEFVNPKLVVLEILEHVTTTAELITRIKQLVAKGYRFALDDVIALSDNVSLLLPYVEIIKIDITDMHPATIASLSKHFRSLGKKLLAEKVETYEQFNICRELSFDYFQGYFFSKPFIISGKKLSLSEQSLLGIMVLLTNNVADDILENAIKRDSFLSINLLRLVNTEIEPTTGTVSTVGDAVRALGRGQLKRWIQLLMYAQKEHGSVSEPVLLNIAATRGALLEAISKKLNPMRQDLAETAFGVGIMSLMDTLYQVPMTAIVEPMTLDGSVTDALLYRKGLFGDMLLVAQYIEDQHNIADISDILQRLSLTPASLYELEVAAFEAASTMSRTIH